MQTITLVLTTGRGHEIGRLPLDTIELATAGQAGSAASVPLALQMDTVYQHIRAALLQQAVAVAVDDIDLRIAVSRALLTDRGADPEMQITLPVQETPSVDTSADVHSAITDWDDLFDLKEIDHDNR